MKRPILPIVLTILLALGAGAAVFWYVTGAEQRALAEQQVATILVTQDAVPEGTTLGQAVSEGLITETAIPERLRPSTALGALDAQTTELVVLSDLPAGQTVMSASVGLAVEEEWPIEVPEGQMAVSVLLDDPSKVGAFLRPGSHVAIFDTYAVPGTGETADAVFETRPLLDDVAVLAVGAVTRVGADSATQEAWDAQLVTVAVTQEQAERLVHATRTGALHFALLGEGTLLKPSAGVSDLTLFP